MRTFDYHAAGNAAEALDLLAQYGDDAHLMAGGTSLMLMMEQGLIQPGHVVGLRGAKELRGIGASFGGIEILALTTHREVERSSRVRDYCPTLVEAFERIATIRIRNQATVGGNLVHADPAQDPPPILLALDAEVVIQSKGGGQRTVPLDGFFRDYFETAVEEGELLTSVRLPAIVAGTKSTYVKFLPRTEDDYATVSVGAALRLGAGGVCEHVRVALGSAAPTPIRARKVEAALQGQRLTGPMIDEAAELVRDEVDPLDDVRGSAKYKREMARVWTGRALRSLLDGGGR